MFSGKIEIRQLDVADLTLVALADINYLLRQQHHLARQHDRESLVSEIGSYRMVLGWQDDRVIATGAVAIVRCPSHQYASIHNVIILKGQGYDIITLGKRVIDCLLEGLPPVDEILAGHGLQDPGLVSILEAYGFRPKKMATYRLKLDEKL